MTTDATLPRADQWIAFRNRDTAALLGSVARQSLFPGEIQERREAVAEEYGLELAQVKISLEDSMPA